MRNSAAIAALGVAVSAIITACGGSSSPAARTAPSSAVLTGSPCPTPAGGKDQPWPRVVPRDLPKPPHITIVKQETTSGGLHVIQFSTPLSLRESVLFVVRQLPKAGYTLGRGDAEASEADAPFSRGDIRGTFKIAAVASCRTQWLLAIGRRSATSGSSFSPSAEPSTSDSDNPFG